MKGNNMEIRSEVLKFAEIMEEKLRVNDHKGGWDDLSFSHLIKRVKDELNELMIAIVQADSDQIQKEAADIANFCMMISDKAEKYKNERTEN